jgi:hypothetical protein
VIDPRCNVVRRSPLPKQVVSWLVLGAALATLAAPRPAHAVNFTLEGGTPQPAWSGYWWPMLTTRGWHLYDQTGPFTPLVKYGQATGNYGPLNWERTYKLTTNPANNWWGHCNGWAAATVLEPAEPKQSVQVRSTQFNTGEVKGLLTAIHQGDPVDLFRGRPHWSGGNYSTDLRALDFHRAVLYYMRDRKEGIIFNLSTKPEVWNYPAYYFRMSGVTDFSDSRRTFITVMMLFADDDVHPSYIGTKAFSRTFTYWVMGDPRDVYSSTAADWTGDSVTNHPQFVWHPAYARPHEPAFGEPPSGIDIDWVKRLGQVSAGTYASP